MEKRPPPDPTALRHQCRGRPPTRPAARGRPPGAPPDARHSHPFSRPPHGLPHEDTIFQPLIQPDPQSKNSAPLRGKEGAMRNSQRLAIYPLALVLLVVLLSSTVSSQSNGKGMVDFRMAPLEQVKKISLHLWKRNGAGETLTVMIPRATRDAGHHLIISEANATSANVSGQLTSGSFDSVSWFRRGAPRPFGACDSDEECEDETDQMCADAGHEGVDEETVTVTVHADGSSTCSGDCLQGGAVAFVSCTN